MPTLLGLAALAMVLAATPAAKPAARDPNALLRTSPQVLVDPQAYYSPALFREKGPPQPGEWMKEHPEPVQTFQEFTASKPVRPTVGRHTIVLSPVGKMTDKERARLDVLREFMEIYYTLPVRIGPPLALEGVKFRDRTLLGNPVRQYLADDILYRVLKPALPADAACLIGTTMDDLYPEEAWNYVFGQATIAQRVGIYSLRRLYPAFWNKAETPEAEHLGMVRGLLLLVHETGHMFGVEHCQKYACAMNGTNSLRESDAQPIHLCPDCLKKCRWGLGFDITTRYEALRKFYAAHAMPAEAEWVAKRIAQCRGEKMPAPAAIPAPARAATPAAVPAAK